VDNEEGAEKKKGFETDNDPIWEFGLDSSQIALFSKLEPIPIELEESGSDGEIQKMLEEPIWILRHMHIHPTCLILILMLK
ncbi:hypothetical protein J1N35_043545, partial [Gossypium stocksii]